MHSVVALLTYLITQKLIHNRFFSLLAALFFISSFTISQTVTWFAAPINTIGTTFFLLLSILYFLYYLEHGTRKELIISYISLYVSTLFKESGLIGLIILPLVFVLYKKNPTLKKGINIFLPSILFVLLILFVRIPPILRGNVARGFTTHADNSKQRIIFHALFYPFISFSQQFIPRQIMFHIAAIFQTNSYSFLSHAIMQSAILENLTSDFISLLITVFLFVICGIISVNVDKLRKPIIFSISFSLLSFLPYIVLDRGTAYLDSRYYYVGMVGGAMFLSMVLYGAAELASKYVSKVRVFVILTIFLVSVLYIYKNIVFIHRDIQSLQFDTAIQMKFLHQISDFLPDLETRQVIYITGNKSYYGIDILHVPLQAGPGYVMMVENYKKGTISPELLRTFFLFDVHEQGYKETKDGKGFGYYADFQTLTSDYKKGLFQKGQLHAFYYDGNAYVLSDITDQTQKELSSIKNN